MFFAGWYQCGHSDRDFSYDLVSKIRRSELTFRHGCIDTMKCGLIRIATLHLPMAAHSITVRGRSEKFATQHMAFGKSVSLGNHAVPTSH